MLASDLLNEYTSRYPVYGELSFSLSDDADSEKLHPLFVLTQHIIDSLIKQEDKRIAIILPDDECSIIPMVLTKYFSNIQHDEYVGSVLNECEPGQRLRLGKAVVEFVGFETRANRRCIIFKTKDKSTISSPMIDVYYLLEKTEGEVTNYKRWYNSKKEAEGNLEESQNTIVDSAMAKRTALKKTIILLTIKNNFKELVNNLKIDRTPFENALSYGEIDEESASGFKLYNKGRLDCLPALSLSARIEEIVAALNKRELADKIFAIFSTADKFGELINNIDALKKCLRKNVPFIAFVPETEFENFPALSALGFELWHWKPSTMRNEVFIAEDADIKKQPLFGGISNKAARAAFATFDTEVVKCNKLKSTLEKINNLGNLVKDGDASIRKITRQLLSFQFNLQAIIGSVSIENSKKFPDLLSDIKQEWETLCFLYEGQDVALIISSILKQFESIIEETSLPKADAFSNRLGIIPGASNVIILVTDRNDSASEIQNYYSGKFPSLKITTMKLSDFYTRKDIRTDYLLVSWFNKQDYIKIKQTYCYDKLIFVLYDFENNWRKNFVKRFDECLPHEHTKKSGVKIGWSDRDYDDRPFDTNIESDPVDDAEPKEIDDYNFHSNIIRSIVKSGSASDNSADLVECIPVMLSGDNIGYFYPTRTLIEVGSLLSGEALRPVKKEARNLRKGDLILIRQSGRDIIREKADELLAIEGKKQLRQISSVWKEALTMYSQDKPLNQVCAALNNAGGTCHIQQVQYWVDGDTICPENKNVLSAIASLSDSEVFNIAVDDVYAAGREIQGYHVRAGRWLNSELKSKTNEIREIIRNAGSIAKGQIDGIGEIIIYTVEEVFEKQYISKNKLNRTEVLD